MGWSRLVPGNAGFLCRNILIMLVIGLAARYLVGYFLTYAYDVQSWALVISNFEAGGGLYDIAGYYYAPPWGYILGFVSVIGEMLGVDMFGARLTEGLPAEAYSDWVVESIVPSIGFALMVKTAFFVSDILVGYVVYRIAMDRSGDQRKATIAFGLWFLCPFVITAGAAQGMFDTFSVLLTLLCVYMVMRDRCLLGGMLMGAAALLKLFPAFLVFVLIGYILVKHRGDGQWKPMILRAAVGLLLMVAIILAPSAVEGTLSECFSFLTSRAESMGPGLGSLVSYATVAAYVAILLASVYIGYRMYRSRARDLDGALLVMLMVNVVVIFLYPSSAQYLVLLVPFLAFQIVLTDRRYLRPMALLMVGVTMFALSRNVVNLLTVAGFTDLLDMGQLVSWIGLFNEPVLLSFSVTDILHVGGVLEYVGILWVLYVFLTLCREGGSGLESDAPDPPVGTTASGTRTGRRPIPPGNLRGAFGTRTRRSAVPSQDDRKAL